MRAYLGASRGPLTSKAVAEALLNMAIAACLIPLIMAWLWRRFQYGTGRLRKPREPIYANATDETWEALEKLFAYLQRESAPRAYYRNWRGTPIYLEYRYFFGNLRVLLLSEFAAVQALCLSPGGNRISGAIKIENGSDEVIKELGTRFKRPRISRVGSCHEVISSLWHLRASLSENFLNHNILYFTALLGELT